MPSTNPGVQVINLTDHAAALAATAVAVPQIPAEIAAGIKSAPTIKSILPITGSERFGQQVIKADEIVFDASAHLVFTNLSAPWVGIAARKIKFRNPNAYSFIERDMTVSNATRGVDGQPGARGADRPGETNRRGNDGDPGGPGGQGGIGGTMNLPTLYIVAEQLIDERDTEIPAGLINLAVLLRGVDGGQGGTGGRGGDGGNAGNGKEGATGAFDCREGPGPGGNGGPSGQGGRGGPGGTGSKGGDVIFVSLKNGAECFTYARVNNQGGLGGQGGRGGSPGTPGAGGQGAGRNGWCGPSGPGLPGGYPTPPNLGDGAGAAEGEKGTMFVVALPNLHAFF
jgi:hypothetical protein